MNNIKNKTIENHKTQRSQFAANAKKQKHVKSAQLCLNIVCITFMAFNQAKSVQPEHAQKYQQTCIHSKVFTSVAQ